MATLKYSLKRLFLLGAITTLGSPWWWWNLYLRAPGRRMIMRGFMATLNPRCKRFWMGLYNMDTVSEAKRKRFLEIQTKDQDVESFSDYKVPEIAKLTAGISLTDVNVMIQSSIEGGQRLKVVFP